MEWSFLIIIMIGIFLYFRLRRRKSDLSMLPEQFVVLDIETTGLNPAKHDIIEIGAVKVNRDSNTHNTFQALVKPSNKIPKKITEITGITQEMIEKDGEEIDSVIGEFFEFIGDLPLVAYNAEFDMSFLRNVAAKSGVSINNPTFCALKMARRAWPGLKSYKLGDLAKIGGLSSKGTHRALKDCELTMTVYSSAASKLRSAN